MAKASRLREADLYAPVKRLLEGQGYAVKGEIGAADVVAVRENEPPVVVEMKTGFSLTLIHQAIARLKVSDCVYVAVPEWSGRAGWKAFQKNRVLCRRLGLGVITVSEDLSSAHVHLDPGSYAPRQSKARRGRLLREFQHRVGDPNEGGASRRNGLITSYRQQALKCLKILHEIGPTKAAYVAGSANVPKARNILAADHYGWFERVERGIYAITPKGAEAITEYASELAVLAAEDDGSESPKEPSRRTATR